VMTTQVLRFIPRRPLRVDARRSDSSMLSRWRWRRRVVLSRCTSQCGVGKRPGLPRQA
jgi:hypothetical protein